MSTKNKYYAVRNGIIPGVYKTWADCQRQIHKFPNAIFKGFPTEQEAQDYLNSSYALKVNLETQDPYDIFVDGSYSNGQYSWAFAVYEGDSLTYSDSGVGQDLEAAKMRNIAGELAAAVKAIEWAEENQMRPITLHHDYIGIAAWADGSWTAKNKFTMAYATFSSERLRWVHFNKVKGHTGIDGNELVDKLAGAALGN